jgi:glutamate--cysteine ligase
VPANQPVLTGPEARGIVAACGFGTPATPTDEADRVGVELEWLVVCAKDRARPAPLEAVQKITANLGPLPGASRLTFEPGGQLELSSAPLPGSQASDALDRDLAVIAPALADVGVGLVAMGLEPGTPRPRVVHSPRYDAMEAFFDADGGAGRLMMASTAALQINVDYGTGDDVATRWRLAHEVGPVLAAAFANSPLADSRPSGWRSARLAIWSALDEGRSTAVTTTGSPPEAWAEYALAARVMLVRCSDTCHVPLTETLSFADWIDHGHRLGWPTSDDLEYHLTTLFPPVRPRGWLELRMIDALPTPWWRVAVGVAVALVTEPDIASIVRAAVEPVRDRWGVAARHGLAHPDLAHAARTCFAAATAVMAPGATHDATDAFVKRYVARGRCPADDTLDAWARTGFVVPDLEVGDARWS